MEIQKRPGIRLKDIAEELNVSPVTVHAALEFFNNSEKAKEIRQLYMEKLEKELYYFKNRS